LSNLFAKILIANRGEIACRIMRTCGRLGIATVAVYSEADKDALHVQSADEAILIGPPAARASYLAIDRIMAAAVAAGADAIHPGYGFLSENPALARACKDAGVTFIGPSPMAIEAMGVKGPAKAFAARLGVPVLEGAFPDDQGEASLRSAAEAIGWPVLLKAVAGGGGRGMRAVHDAADFASALSGARREASSAFGDDRMLVERLVRDPRHIEVQILADRHGAVVHLFERDCSLQRRHQKVIEEAPAPGMTPEIRLAMCGSAIRLARAIDYEGLGTVEFVADAAGGLSEDRYWFLEMNTRLQVEHTVTEAITGFDLVEQQIRVAAGDRLQVSQGDIRISGHAVEVRLCAEDPRRDDRPAPGRIDALQFPAGVRVETGLRQGDVVTPWYDSLLAKVIAHGQSREAAIGALTSALAHTTVGGLSTNLELLDAAVRHPEFKAGRVDTGFLRRFRAELLP
jgi:3-methylcrotonyl-CoA carboxylase alpha subunit